MRDAWLVSVNEDEDGLGRNVSTAMTVEAVR
jgi:hypothetical protein